MKILKVQKHDNSIEINILGLTIKHKYKKEKDTGPINHISNNRVLNYFIAQTKNDELKKWYMRQLFYNNVHYFPNFDNPKTFNEKIHWMKLYYQNPLITKCCDKFAVKEYVSELLGKEYVVPTIAVWDNVNDIDFDSLPDKFVLKVNWASGYNIIVKDKSKLDINKTKAKISSWMQPFNNSYFVNFNWGYKNMKPVIYAEEYIGELEGDIPDYKFMCFNGDPKCLFVVSDRRTKMSLNFYDLEWNLLPFTRLYPNSKHPLKKPKNFDKMVELAKELSKPFPFVRVDFYEIGDKVMLGEMTFYPGGGLEPFTPEEWDYKMGEYITIPEKIIEEEA